MVDDDGAGVGVATVTVIVSGCGVGGGGVLQAARNTATVIDTGKATSLAPTKAQPRSPLPRYLKEFRAELALVAFPAVALNRYKASP